MKTKGMSFNRSFSCALEDDMDYSDKYLDGLDEQDLKELIEWPCQDFHGGRMPFLGDPLCRHSECHPLNDDRYLRSDPSNLRLEKHDDTEGIK